MSVRVWLLSAALMCGCAERDDAGNASAPPPPPDDAAPAPAIDAAAPLSAEDATPAWQAVVDRHRTLARRGDRALVVGRVGATIDGATWLIDEREGDGLLGIRVAPPIEGPVDAVAVVAGAWDYDAATERWLWRAGQVTLDTSAAPSAFAHAVGHEVHVVDEAPATAVLPSAATSKSTVVFNLIGAPVKVGDGWPIADERRGDQVAWLVLPGEHPVYGGQDMLAAAEAWQLDVGRRYVVDVGRIRRPRRSLPVFKAVGPPRAIR